MAATTRTPCHPQGHAGSSSRVGLGWHAEHTASGSGLEMCVEMISSGAALLWELERVGKGARLHPPGTYALVNWNSQRRELILARCAQPCQLRAAE